MRCRYISIIIIYIALLVIIIQIYKKIKKTIEKNNHQDGIKENNINVQEEK